MSENTTSLPSAPRVPCPRRGAAPRSGLSTKKKEAVRCGAVLGVSAYITAGVTLGFQGDPCGHWSINDYKPHTPQRAPDEV